MKTLHWRGIEPLTPWFVARYSIQLSYQCKERSLSLQKNPGSVDFGRFLQTFYYLEKASKNQAPK